MNGRGLITISMHELERVKIIESVVQHRLTIVLCAAGYNLRWLLRAIAHLGLRPVFFVLALLNWLVNVTPNPFLARCKNFRPACFRSPADRAVSFAPHAN